MHATVVQKAVVLRLFEKSNVLSGLFTSTETLLPQSSKLTFNVSSSSSFCVCPQISSVAWLEMNVSVGCVSLTISGLFGTIEAVIALIISGVGVERSSLVSIGVFLISSNKSEKSVVVLTFH